MAKKKLSRRQFLIASAAGTAGVMLAACGPAAVPTTVPSDPTKAPVGVTPTETTAATGGSAPAVPAGSEKTARGFVEPPFLAERVAAGKLPPIDERLPVDTFVVGPGTLMQEEFVAFENGQYGGEIDVAATFATGFVNISGGATILRSPSQTTKISAPNIVSAYTISDDFTTYNFTIRKGLRWSDGEPVTTEAVRFTFEDLYQDPDVQRGWPTELYTQGNSEYGPAQLTIIDDFNFELMFSKPYGAFVANLNSWIPYYDFMLKPAHYLKQFHAKYAKKEELDAELKRANETSWVKLLNSKDVAHWDCGDIRALGMPVLNAWVVTEATDDRTIFERNPYFWHVDSNGLQLPYIDRVVNNRVIDTKAQTNAIMAGKVTIASGSEVALNNMPVYVQAAEKFGKRIFTTGSFNNPLMLFLNHDYEYDKEGSAWQTLITDPDHRFGQAVAAAMDPNEVNKAVFFGKYSEPFMNNKDHDLDKAKKLLDELGMDKLGSDGFRLGPDGQPFIFRITFPPGASDTTPVAELLKEQIGQAGLHVELEPIDGTLYEQRKSANEIMVSLSWNDGMAWASGISEDYLPNHKGPWSPMTWLYFTSKGAQGRTPPAYIQAFYDLHTARKEYPPESEKGSELYGKMYQWLMDNYVMIPTTGPQTKPQMVDANLMNVPKEGSPFDLDVYIASESYWFNSK